jgi:activating signal cointegrator 1
MSKIMKAISLWQPWASLWLSPAKIHETRHWPIKHRGWLVVHAARRTIDDYRGDDLDQVCDRVFGKGWNADLPLGALIGAVNIIECKRTEDILSGYQEPDDYVCGDFSKGRYGWKRDKLIVFDKPIPYSGKQRIFSVSDSLLPIELLSN